MRYIKTSNDLVEFIEASNEGQILSVRAFQFGELYFQIKNRKVTFYLNDQENPWRNDVWSADIPLQIDEEVYETEEETSAALHSIMNDSFQEQLDELKEDLAAEVTRSTAKDAEHDALISGLTDNLDQEIADRIADVDAEEARALAAESALTDALNDEITRSTAKDAEHDAEISGLSTSLQNEINRAVGAENSLRDDLNDEVSARTSADTAMVQRITALEVGKADKSDVYTKAESDAKYATKEYVSGNTYTKAEITTMLADKADKVNAVSTALYNSQSKTIDLKNIYGNVVASIDARDFIKDGMVDNVVISNNNLVITFNTDAGKEDIVVPLTDIFDPSNYYNKSEIDTIVDNIESGITQDLSNYYTKAETDEAIADAIDDIDLSNYYTKSEVDASQTAQDNKINAISANTYTKSEVDASQLVQDNKINAISGDVQTLSGEVQTISGDIITSGDVQTQIDNSISGKADKTEIYTYEGTDRIKVSTAAGIRRKAISLNLPIYSGNGLSSLSLGAPIGTTQGGNQINGSLSTGIGWGLNTKNPSEVATGQFNISNTVGAVSWGDSGNTLFSVGNGNHQGDEHNAFEVRQNGDIYISSGGTTSSIMIKLQDHLGGGGGGGVTPTEVQTMIDNSLVGYQEELTAGTNVQINNNVISATDTKYTAGDGIDITNNVISTVTKFWCGTQAQYDAITIKDPNTVYMIHE